MFSRSVRGSALVRGLVMVAVSSLFAGCGEKPPVEKVPTVEEQAQEKVVAAEEALKAGDLAKAEELAAEADKLVPDSGKAVLAEIQKKREEDAAKKRQKEIQDTLKAGDTALEANNLDEAEAKYNKVLEIDPGNADAQAGLSKVAAAKVKPGAKEYSEINERINAAIRSRDYRRAISEIGRLERYVDAASGRRSRRRDIPGLEAKLLEAEGDTAMGRRQWDRAIEKFQAALNKERTAQRASKLRRARDEKSKVAEGAAKDRRYNDAMRNGRRQASEGRYAQARRSYEEAKGHATDSRKRRAAEAEIARVGRELGYSDAIKAGDQCLARGDYAGAEREYSKAQRVKPTPKVANKLQSARAGRAEAEGDTAMAGKSYALAVEKYELAASLEPTPGRAGKKDKAVAEKAHADYHASIASFTAAREQGRFMSIKADLDALVKAHPEWKEAAKLAKLGPTDKELKGIETKATKAYSKLTADLRKVKPTNHTQKIAIIRAALPDLAYSKKEKAAKKTLNREVDAVLLGKYKKEVTDPLKDKKKAPKGQAKIDYLKSIIGGYKDSGFQDKIETMIDKEQGLLEVKAMAGLNKEAAKKKKPAEKLALYRARQAGFKSATNVKKIEKLIATQNNIIKGKDYSALGVRVAKLKTPESKIAEYQRSLPNFKDSKFEGMITKAIGKQQGLIDKNNLKKLLANWKKAKDPKQKIAILESGRAQFAKDSKLGKKVDKLIDKGKKGLEKAVFSKVSADAKKIKAAAARLKYLEGKAGEFKSKTYQTKIKGMIDAAKKQVKAEAGKAKEAAARKVYDKAAADVKKVKDNAAKIQVLTAALQDPKIVGTKYVEMLRSQIKKLQPKPPKQPKKKK